MSKVVAVEEGLTPVRDYLAAKGCQIIGIEQAKQTNVDAIVISGVDNNVMGMQDIVINAPIIVNAKGRNAVEIWNDIRDIDLKH